MSLVSFNRRTTFSLITHVLTGALLVLDNSVQIHFHLCFSFPNFTPGCPDSITVFLPSYPFLYLPSLHFLFAFEFYQELFFIHVGHMAFFSDSLFVGMHCSWTWRSCSLNINKLPWALPPSRVFFLWTLPSRSPKTVFFSCFLLPSISLYIAYSIRHVHCIVKYKYGKWNFVNSFKFQKDLRKLCFCELLTVSGNHGSLENLWKDLLWSCAVCLFYITGTFPQS